ncbi:MAG: hypothetical protein J2O46_07545, partial [Nocardioides sp.]|nr:hypothetical protein [Nocardioides sp.]
MLATYLAVGDAASSTSNADRRRIAGLDDAGAERYTHLVAVAKWNPGKIQVRPHRVSAASALHLEPDLRAQPMPQRAVPPLREWRDPFCNSLLVRTALHTSRPCKSLASLGP